MQTIDRAMEIIGIISGSEAAKWLSITEISKECDLPVSTIHRLLQSMKKYGLIQQDPNSKHYTLGNKWLEYGLQLYDSFDFVGQIRPEMERLMNEVGESIYYNKPFGLESLVVERIDCPTNPIRIYDQLGNRIPMHIGAANKAMLAFMPHDEALRIVGSLVAVAEQEVFLEKLQAVKLQGYGISHGEKTKGTSAVAAPIFNQMNELIGAISIGYVNFQVSEDREKLLIDKIVEYGRRISAKLGWR
ncbi:IclR family transcriptional regulator [Neobacillus niacini]|uniref:IclR family transcriptional regulator n=1 Tax=Neobacillus niacini TaxID=86668 RepID=UPI002862FC16|nr:IclR family transcriptional regulator [Neobacillus niacini]MDR6998915.1 DNA-binding IclR family transcriptional regulator [Neobacillus niacini]